MQTYTRKQTAELLQISERTLDRYIRAGKLEVSKVSGARAGRVFITEKALDKFLKGNIKKS